MPIKTTPTGNIPYLLNYTEYKLPAGIIPVDTIQDMISFNWIIPEYTPSIDYNIGSLEDDYKILVVKNLTIATTLNVYLDYDNQIFSIRERDTNIEPQSFEVQSQVSTTTTVPERKISPIPIVLRGGTEATFIVKYNKKSLDSYTDYTTLSTYIQARIENVFDEKLATKSIAVKELNKERLDPTTTVV